MLGWRWWCQDAGYSQESALLPLRSLSKVAASAVTAIQTSLRIKESQNQAFQLLFWFNICILVIKYINHISLTEILINKLNIQKLFYTVNKFFKFGSFSTQSVKWKLFKLFNAFWVVFVCFMISISISIAYLYIYIYIMWK